MVHLIKAMQRRKFAVPCLVISDQIDAAGLQKASELEVITQHIPGGPQFETAALDILHARGVEILCLAGFMRVLSADFLARFSHPILNIHPSLLPKYKGLNTHQRALDAGETHHGCTVHRVTGDLDDGPILGQARLAIDPSDTPESLAARVLPYEHRLYPAVLRAVAENAQLPIQIG